MKPGRRSSWNAVWSLTGRLSPACCRERFPGAGPVACLVVIALLVVSCAAQNRAGYRVISRAGFQAEEFRSADFEHRLYYNSRESNRLHVYIDGDGTPWVRGVVPARDPTPRNPLVLRLMSLDDHAAVYVTRPCYFNTGPKENCYAERWTAGRYSSAIVNSMAAAIIDFAGKHGNPDILLIGYSGGGVLATLIAQQLTTATGLVTVAANLDVGMWIETFGLLPLSGSLNPAELDSVRSDLLQLHFVGELDEVVPQAVTSSYVEKHGGELIVIPGVNHNCCWENNWKSILDRIDEAFENGSSFAGSAD